MADPFGPPSRSPETSITLGGPRHASRKPDSPEPSSPRRGLLRPRSVRAKIVAALMVPVVSLIALWAYVTVTTVQEVALQGDLRDVEAFGTDGVVVVLGLVAVLLSVLISIRVARRLPNELVKLRDTAMDLAARELNSATERSHVVRGVSSVYVHLARRSQVLLHRQLELLDAMERRTEDPQDLDSLFRMDHLTTRMRRQAESLIILSGGSPARHWRHPVPAIDVVRAAIAEVEDFTRVQVQDMVDTNVTGGAVADLTHLIAELVENAITFSPPHTKALVRGRLVGAGLAIEIEDRGLGMSDAALADANKRVQDAGQVDLLEAEQLGHFVVNRLAHRQKVEVTLQRSPFGGVTAVVLVPDRLLDNEDVRAGGSAGRTDADEIPGVRTGGTEPAGQRDVRESPWQVISTVTGGKGSAPDERHVLAEAEVAGPDVKSAVADPGYVAVGGPDAPGGVPSRPTGELPRRVRQANLAPELRDDAPLGASPTAPQERDRTPEQARATLEALRSGWVRGRNETEDRQGDRR